MRESQDNETGAGQCLVSEPILRLLGRRSVIGQPIGLDNEVEVRPAEVDPKSMDTFLGFRLRQLGSSDQPEKSPLQLRISQGEGGSVENAPKRASARRSVMSLQFHAK
jgi:hypothetical protein